MPNPWVLEIKSGTYILSSWPLGRSQSRNAECLWIYQCIITIIQLRVSPWMNVESFQFKIEKCQFGEQKCISTLLRVEFGLLGCLAALKSVVWCAGLGAWLGLAAISGWRTSKAAFWKTVARETRISTNVFRRPMKRGSGVVRDLSH